MAASQNAGRLWRRSWPPTSSASVRAAKTKTRILLVSTARSSWGDAYEDWRARFGLGGFGLVCLVRFVSARFRAARLGLAVEPRQARAEHRDLGARGRQLELGVAALDRHQATHEPAL